MKLSGELLPPEGRVRVRVRVRVGVGVRARVRVRALAFHFIMLVWRYASVHGMCVVCAVPCKRAC